MKTSVLIRPGARGGKYLGPDAATANMSALAIICDAKTGKPITAGIVNTLGKDPGPGAPLINIMNAVHRCSPFATDAATVGVVLDVDIDVPTTFNFQVFGPLSHIDQARLAQAEITLLPGYNIGVNSAEFPEGIVIEIPGLSISNVVLNLDKPNAISCTANVTMMCGCVIEDTQGWYWPPEDFEIKLVVEDESGKESSFPLSFVAGSKSQFSLNREYYGGKIVKAWLTAFEPKLGNQGCYQIIPKQEYQLPEGMAEKFKMANVDPAVFGIK